METASLPGITRSVVKTRYALLTPGGFLPSHLPGWEKAVCQVLVSPALGAGFSQVLITMEHDGQCVGNTGANQYFIYVLDGNASIVLDDRRHRLETGSYVYLPPGKDVQIKGGGAATRVLIFQKEYRPLPGVSKPAAMIGTEREVKGQAVHGNEDARAQVLLPDQPAFDFAVNILTCQPGAAPPHVETHVMEHGLVMLRGQGIFRLEEDWHPVQAGDVLWIAPYCPQWFVAIGKSLASYIYYQDVNRDPM